MRALKAQVHQSDQEISTLSEQLKSAVSKYEDAILDVQKAQKEKDDLRDQVERLRSELREERKTREDLEAEIDRKRTRERTLHDMMDVMRAEADNARRVMGVAQRSEAERPEEQRTARRERSHRHRSITINIQGGSSSDVKSIFPSSSSSKKGK
jgi:chromosome segregation ATPase